MSKKKRAVGRPKSISDEIAKEICARLSNGETLLKICREKEMPCRDTVYETARVDQNFSDMYARARRNQILYMFEEILEIADDKLEHPFSRRIRIDTRKWFLCKLVPKFPSLRGSLAQKAKEIVEHMSSGNISVETGDQLLGLVETMSKINKVDEHEQRLSDLDNTNKAMAAEVTSLRQKVKSLEHLEEASS